MTMISHCFTHGNLTIDQVIKRGKDNGIQRYRCKECYRTMRKINYENNKQAILAKNIERRKADPEKYAKIKADSRRKHIEKHREKERIRHKKLNRKARAELHDWYVKKVITKRTGLRNCDIPQGLVELKRTTLKIERKIRKIKEEIT